MTIDNRQLARVARRMKEATGYLELGMPQHTLECLEGLGDLGPFEAEVELLRGYAFRMQRRYDDAAAALKSAARKSPSPQDKSAWLALSNCYRQAGDTNRAIHSLARARGAGPPRRKPKTL
ncbi:MAG: tetratricopeptide repeat protein [Planctomycetota bacterium]